VNGGSNPSALVVGERKTQQKFQIRGLNHVKQCLKGAKRNEKRRFIEHRSCGGKRSKNH